MTDKTCPACEGRKPGYFEGWCDQHNVCIGCGCKRKDLPKPPWHDTRGAFQCHPCEEKERAERIAARQAEEFDHDGTDEVVCPHCGYEYSDSQEMADGDHTCYECEKDFELEREHTVTYSTSVKK